VAWRMPIGARPDGDGTHFRVWAAAAGRVEVVLYDDDIIAAYELIPEGDGYFSAHIAGIVPGARYKYRLNHDLSDPDEGSSRDEGGAFPDPASRFQPEGVHGPSQVVESAFAWSDGGWRGVALEDLVIYELHVGAATPEGTFDALIARLDDIRDLGATAIELMPVADFPGARNWGYDGVCLFAPSRAYGGPAALRRLVDAAHARGLAVLLDVVYNHLGPDGNVLRQFSPAYFTSRHTTPWGEALNFDGPDSRPVRDFFIANACYWIHEYHLDGLRLDATHTISDESQPHILTEIAERVRESLPPDRQVLLVAEDDRNDPQLVRPASQGGYGLDAVWADDFHHLVRVALAGDHDGYYMDYRGSAEDLARTLSEGWFYSGQYSAYLGRPRGAPATDLDPSRLIYCIQNHDQVGNRALGERLNHQIGLDAYRAAAALLLLGPYTPLLFMGQEWAATTPFLYFTDHHTELGRLVTEGRRAEFARFTAFSGKQVPDPQALDTFLRSKLRWGERDGPPQAGVLSCYHDLLGLRRRLPALRERGRESFTVVALSDDALALRRAGSAPDQTLVLVVNLRGELRLDLRERAETAPPVGCSWTIALDTEDSRYGGRAATVLSANGSTLELARPGAVVLQAAWVL
jgi:maltooligosyltrehalose trehalohydrolase